MKTKMTDEKNMINQMKTNITNEINDAPNEQQNDKWKNEEANENQNATRKIMQQDGTHEPECKYVRKTTYVQTTLL